MRVGVIEKQLSVTETEIICMMNVSPSKSLALSVESKAEIDTITHFLAQIQASAMQSNYWDCSKQTSRCKTNRNESLNDLF